MAAQTSSAPVATVAIVLAVALVTIIIVTRVAGVTGAQRRTWIVAAVVAIRDAVYTSATILSLDTIVPPVGGDPTPHAGAPPDRDRAPHPHIVTVARPCSGGRRGAHSVARLPHRSITIEYAVTGGTQIAMR